MILYQPPTIWSLLRGTAINLILPFINGMMLGFGELFAHEAAFRLGWGGTKVGGRLRTCTNAYIYCSSRGGAGGVFDVDGRLTCRSQVFPLSRRTAHPIGPGVEVREMADKPEPSFDDLTSLE
jgi:hypothetical protein